MGRGTPQVVTVRLQHSIIITITVIITQINQPFVGHVILCHW